VNPTTLLRIPIVGQYQDLVSQAAEIGKRWLGQNGTITFDSENRIVMESPINRTSAVQHTKIELLTSYHPDVFPEFLSDEERSALCLVTIGISKPDHDQNKTHHYLKPQRLMHDLAEGLPMPG